MKRVTNDARDELGALAARSETSSWRGLGAELAWVDAGNGSKGGEKGCLSLRRTAWREETDTPADGCGRARASRRGRRRRRRRENSSAFCLKLSENRRAEGGPGRPRGRPQSGLSRARSDGHARAQRATISLPVVGDLAGVHAHPRRGVLVGETNATRTTIGQLVGSREAAFKCLCLHD